MNPPYTGVITDIRTFTDTNAKIYFVDITGRDDPSKTEWEHSEFNNKQGEVADRIKKIIENDPGDKLVIAFPHVTAFYRILRSQLHRGGLAKTSLDNMVLDEQIFPYAVGCPAELIIAGEEMKHYDGPHNFIQYSTDVGQIIHIEEPNKLSSNPLASAHVIFDGPESLHAKVTKKIEHNYSHIPHIAILDNDKITIYRYGDPATQQETSMYLVGEIVDLESCDIRKPTVPVLGSAAAVTQLAQETNLWAKAKTIDEYIKRK